jgi:hypothetical protein
MVDSRPSNSVSKFFREFFRQELRYSYIVNGILILIGVVVNFFLPHGWTVWPVVLGAGIITMIHEAADRNGQGIPPLTVYLFFACAFTSWAVLTAVIAAVNPAILMFAVLAAVWYGWSSYRKHVKILILQRFRVANGLCIHCGEPADSSDVFCMNCGEEPNPETLQRQRINSISRSAEETVRRRHRLMPQSTTAAAKAKEMTLMARKRGGRAAAIAEAQALRDWKGRGSSGK